MRNPERKVSKLLDEQLSSLEIAERLGVHHSTVSRIAARTGRRLAPARGSRFDWDAIRSYYEEGHTIAECCRRFGMSRGAWGRAVSRGDVVPRPKVTPPPSKTRKAVKRLLDDGKSQAEIAKELGLSKATIARGLTARTSSRGFSTPVSKRTAAKSAG